MAARRLAVVALLALLVPVAGAAQDPGTERVLVSLDRPLDPALRTALQRLGVDVREDFPAAAVVLADAPASSRSFLRALPGVAGVYAEERLDLLLSSSRPAVRVGPALWDAGFDGSGVGVAVVDSGIDASHPGLAGRVARAVRVDDAGVQPGSGDRDGHGTHIAGIVAGDGAGSADARHAGMAPRAGLVAVDISGAFTTTSAVRAFQWIHDHARDLEVRVVSNSWGREREDAAYDADDPVIRASDALVRAGLVVVFSAGNRGPGPSTLTVESQNPHVLTVGAANDEGRIESYSSRGPARLSGGGEAAWPKPDVTAPGTRIVSARAGAARGGEAYTMLNGTSMAAPHVAGIVALLLDAHPGLSPEEVKDLLRRTARDRGAGGFDPDNGFGFVDAQRAVQAARDAAAPQVVQEREAFRGAGEVRPAAALLPDHLPTGPREVREAIAVPPGAVGLEFAFRWDDPRSDFTLTLEKDAVSYGPFRGATARPGGMEVRGSVPQALEPGLWTLVARPSGPSLSARYTLDGAVLVRHALPPPPVEEEREPGSFPELLAQGTRDAVLGPASLLLLALAGPGLVLAWRWRGGRRLAAFDHAEPAFPWPGAAARGSSGPKPPPRAP